jgi:membrane protease YdiL (CAAX protease family)
VPLVQRGEIDLTPVLVMALLGFAAVLATRRRDALVVRFTPDRHTWTAIATCAAVAAASASILLVGPGSSAARAIHVLVIYALLGCAVPWGYTLFVEGGSPADLGLRRQGSMPALAINLAMGALLGLGIVFGPDLDRVSARDLAAASFTLLVGGLFELYLYYGFTHLRLERAFGPIPAIFGTAALYSLWHIGTELPLHDDPWRGLLFLFVVGVLYQSIFSLTRRLISIWPFFFLAGVLTDFLRLGLPDRVTRHLEWAVAGWILMLGIPAVLYAFCRRTINRRSAGRRSASRSERGAAG